MEFEGIYPPVITPFNDDQSVDERGWADMIDYQIENGAHGVVIGGTTGEFYALTRDERLDQFRKAPDVVGGRVPWLAGVNDFQTESVCAYASAAKEAGADALLLAAPPYALPTERELAAHCLRVERAAKLPIMLYNYPGRTGVMMGEEFLERVGRNANFFAIKESSGDIHRIHLLAREFPHLQLSCGIDDLALEFFVWAREAGSARPPTARFPRRSPFLRLAWLSATSKKAAESCRRCCRCPLSWSAAASSCNASSSHASCRAFRAARYACRSGP